MARGAAKAGRGGGTRRVAKANPRAGRTGKKPAVATQSSTAAVGLGAAATLAATAAIAVIAITGTVDVVQGSGSAPEKPEFVAKYETPVIRASSSTARIIADAPKSAPATKSEDPTKKAELEKLSIRERAEREASKATPKAAAQKKAKAASSSSDNTTALGAVAVVALAGGAYFYSQKDKEGGSSGGGSASTPRKGKPAAPKVVSPKTGAAGAADELRWAGEAPKEEEPKEKEAQAAVPANVAEARQWIADWEEKTGGDEFSSPPENVQEARKWIADWKERSGGDES